MDKKFFLIMRLIREEIVAMGFDLKKVVAECRQWNSHLTPDDVQVIVCVETDGNAVRAEVPKEVYSYAKQVTRAEADAFIAERDAKLSDPDENVRALARIWGALRCDPDDPHDKQVLDYMSSAPRGWLNVEHIAY